MLNKRLYISKNKQEIEAYLPFFHKNKIEVIAHSFLQFVPLNFQVKKPYQVIFFGSPRAVTFFLQQESIPENVLIACIGEITAQSIQKAGYIPHFIGSNAGSPSEVAQAFKSFVGTLNVLFPQSSSSNRSVASVFNPNQIIELSIYQTVVHSRLIDPCDYYVFTSPSNVEGFLKENSISNQAKVIAWGKTTQNYLLSQKINVNQTLTSTSMDELILLLSKEFNH